MLTAFAEFKRGTQEYYKDVWARFARCAAKLEALGMPMDGEVVFNRAIRALWIPDGGIENRAIFHRNSAWPTQHCRAARDHCKDV